MEIKLAKEMGFCFGVRRAINLVEKEAKQRVDTNITTYGALVHNPLVVNRMEKLGVGVVERGDMSQITSGVITFTAHGVTPQIIEEAKERGFEVMDATCPLVTIIQQAARKMVEEGYTLIVFGDRNHPEVKGILGWAGGDAFATMDINDLKEMRPPKRLGIVTQSTQILEKFRDYGHHFWDRRKLCAHFGRVDKYCASRMARYYAKLCDRGSVGQASKI